MNKMRVGAVLLPALVCLSAGIAQAQGKPPESFAYATYHVCDVSKQDRADEIYAELMKPIREAAVADGSITLYGYNAHHTGGR